MATYFHRSIVACKGLAKTRGKFGKVGFAHFSMTDSYTFAPSRMVTAENSSPHWPPKAMEPTAERNKTGKEAPSICAKKSNFSQPSDQGPFSPFSPSLPLPTFRQNKRSHQKGEKQILETGQGKKYLLFRNQALGVGALKNVFFCAKGENRQFQLQKGEKIFHEGSFSFFFNPSSFSRRVVQNIFLSPPSASKGKHSRGEGPSAHRFPYSRTFFIITVPYS